MAASSPPPGLVSVSSRESYFETTLQKRAHRPLHAQISTLLAEREELLIKNQELAEKNGELQWRLSQAIEESVAKHADTVLSRWDIEPTAYERGATAATRPGRNMSYRGRVANAIKHESLRALSCDSGTVRVSLFCDRT